jgi:hypothetical protein
MQKISSPKLQANFNLKSQNGKSEPQEQEHEHEGKNLNPEALT